MTPTTGPDATGYVGSERATQHAIAVVAGTAAAGVTVAGFGSMWSRRRRAAQSRPWMAGHARAVLRPSGAAFPTAAFSSIQSDRRFRFLIRWP